jgi:predicted ATP-grasp superfamily ATP-dependent carboligase
MVILFVSGKLSAFLKTVSTLLLLLIALPFNLLLVSLALVGKVLTIPFSKSISTENGKKVLITGGKMTKALQLARLFNEAGHEVTLVETDKYWLSGHRFSFAVKNFYTVPAPEKDTPGYCQGLLDIVKRENIDLVIPVSSPVASYYDSVAKTKLQDYCEVLHFDPEVTKMLDDKYSLCQKALELGLSAPKSFTITNPQQVLDFDFASDGNKYILKSIQYDSVTRLDLTQLPFENGELCAIASY